MEAGPHARDAPNHIQPARYFNRLDPPTETMTFHVAKPSSALCNRSVMVATGRVLGGGSSVNGMKIIFVVDVETEVIGSSPCLYKGGSLRLRRLGKCLWEQRMGL